VNRIDEKRKKKRASSRISQALDSQTNEKKNTITSLLTSIIHHCVGDAANYFHIFVHCKYAETSRSGQRTTLDSRKALEKVERCDCVDRGKVFGIEVNAADETALNLPLSFYELTAFNTCLLGSVQLQKMNSSALCFATI
jgi:hypothetical protein